ncbi:MAG: DUF4157 domain-containing protein [Moorea sp. SIO3H5]|nr:DUF4157 domain-containing protein [Moorena sp. SIO3H5]
MSAKVMRTLESGVTQPERGRREMGLQGMYTFGQPGERSWQGANNGGQLVVQPKRIMVQRAAQPLTGDSVTYGESYRAESSKKENKTGLPDRLKAGIENLSGYSMDDVRVHYNSEKPAQLQALAYAQGTEIHVGPGQEKHLPHEAWHVVQQKEGRVKPKVHMQSLWKLNLNNEQGLEREADEMGREVLNTEVGNRWQKNMDGKRLGSNRNFSNQPPVIQRKVIKFDSETELVKAPGEALVSALDWKKFNNINDQNQLRDEINLIMNESKRAQLSYPSKVYAHLDYEKKSKGELSPLRTEVQTEIGHHGRDEFYIRTGNLNEAYEGGHIIPNHLFVRGEDISENAGSRLNLVPMSRSMNVIIWSEIEKEMSNKASDLNAEETLLVNVQINRNNYKVSYGEIAERFDIQLADGVSENELSSDINAWIPNSLKPIFVKKKGKNKFSASIPKQGAQARLSWSPVKDEVREKMLDNTRITTFAELLLAIQAEETLRKRIDENLFNWMLKLEEEASRYEVLQSEYYEEEEMEE